MSEFQKISLAKFSRLPGRLFAVVHINGDVADHVQVVKAEFIEALRWHEVTEVEYYRADDGDLVYMGGR